MSARCKDAPELRAMFRAATQDDHQALDSALGSLDLANREDYVRFLRVQAAARRGVEHWLARHAPPQWLPPQQVFLIERDLEALDSDDRGGAPDFAIEAVAPDAWLGVAWVLAGSSLGNRLMERDLTARAPADWPMAFLRDEAMPAYFKALRPLLGGTERSVTGELAASAVFAHFMAEARRHLAMETA